MQDVACMDYSIIQATGKRSPVFNIRIVKIGLVHKRWNMSARHIYYHKIVDYTVMETRIFELLSLGGESISGGPSTRLSPLHYKEWFLAADSSSTCPNVVV